MTAQIALVLCIVLVVYLLRRDFATVPQPSTAIWIPTLWLLINGSRQVSQWIGSGPRFMSEALQEGNSIDQAVYGTLILAGIAVLGQRSVRIDWLAKNNKWLVLFFIYEGISFVWSDFPFVTFKRWIKASGDVVMVLVLVSDQYPVRAITAAIKRAGFILIPVSVLFIKYFEDVGRVIDDWGRSYYTGVTLDKNMFGYLLFAYGVFFASGLIAAIRQGLPSWGKRRVDIACYAMLLVMIVWLTSLADSKTSLFGLVIGVMAVIALQFPQVKRNFWTFLIAAVSVAAVANSLFSVKSVVLEASGRDASLTGRTGIWETVLNEPINPILGTGYASFWLGERLQRIWKIYPNTPLIQAHNGYLEAYLNLGFAGLALLGGLLWTGLRNAVRRLKDMGGNAATLDEAGFSAFGTAYVLAYFVYNATEATFMGLNFLFIIFLTIAVDHRRPSGCQLDRSTRPERGLAMPVAAEGLRES